MSNNIFINNYYNIDTLNDFMNKKHKELKEVMDDSPNNLSISLHEAIDNSIDLFIAKGSVTKRKIEKQLIKENNDNNIKELLELQKEEERIIDDLKNHIIEINKKRSKELTNNYDYNINGINKYNQEIDELERKIDYLLSNYSTNNKALNDSYNDRKNFKKKNSISVKKLADIVNIIDNIKIENYNIIGEERILIKNILLEEGYEEENANILSNLISNYENMKLYTLKQDLRITKYYLMDKKRKTNDYEKLLNQNEKSKIFYEYLSSYRNYINNINLGLMIKDRDINEFLYFYDKTNQIIKEYIVSSIYDIKNVKNATNEADKKMINLYIELEKTDKASIGGIYSCFIDGSSDFRYNYNRFLYLENDEKYIEKKGKINNAIIEHELNNKKKKTLSL